MTAERIDLESDQTIVSSEEPYDAIQDRKLKRLGEALRTAQAIYADEACGKDGKRQIIIS